jgi:hypothetical protein
MVHGRRGDICPEPWRIFYHDLGGDLKDRALAIDFRQGRNRAANASSE